ncbi:tRNA 2-selenouridine(34) synthase MnmH [Dyadobacter sp. Leaf189]|uniref:tRNA 2-selenouridine(34) synthase MnmH n=1 Tax=Dyadobacter sp. Leaf189 TaxID=1736295 RepID=UPI0006FBFD21|nr:tRNA 2-selenouridine(34) synthase MnmH [Dyadobacter sp. Leaf189]KQS30735.1 tRNA 2-selenouridine synthase [Dyadobacter sp. Leaf189]
MINNISIQEYLSMQAGIVLADVRTPAEFEHAHIPGAVNLPLFSNQERVLVGTTYKQVSREAAILLGFDLTGNKWSGFIRQALELAPDKRIALHCWRGGMRSGAMAWALDLYGFEVFLIRGGYKSYRQWANQQFAREYELLVLGGMTGSGKTRQLGWLREMGEQVIDLEELARHQGSAYGTMNKMIQPTQEQFENNLAWVMKDIDGNRRVWLEDENLNIGKVTIPRALWASMIQAPLLNVEVDINIRVAGLVGEYGALDKDFLIACTQRIHKRLGPLQTTQAIEAIQQDKMDDFIRIVLVYYDKAYLKALARSDPGRIHTLALAGDSLEEQVRQILDFAKTIKTHRVQSSVL